MCAIAGILRFDGGQIERGVLAQMAERLAHRGPDGQALHIEPGIGLAHRRLSVIDLATGGQPMANEDGSVVVVTNGEIYNFVALRDRLTAAGHRFATGSDTEVIVHGWEAWGAGLVEHLEGMFAFAIWDRRQRVLFLARDRLGKKPLHYAFLPDGFAFASELRAFAALPGLVRRIDPWALDDYLALGYVPDPATIFAGIAKLPPAHCLWLDPSSGVRPRAERYWRPAAAVSLGGFAEAAVTLRTGLVRAVADRLVADVPLGAFLSGGIDSAGVVAAAGRRLDSFTIGFPGSEDESPAAAAIARHLDVPHTIERTEGLDWVGAALDQGRVFGEPFGDPSAVPTGQLCRLARRHVTVALSGDGGDEVFAGYRRHRWHLLVEAARRYLPPRLRRGPIAALARLYPKLDRAPRFLRARHTLSELSLDSALGYYRMAAQLQHEQRRGLLDKEVCVTLDGYDPGQRFVEAMEASGSEDPLAQAQHADLATWLPGRMLTKLDRTSMAEGLEVRCPLLDHRLVAWGLALPADYKVRRGRGKAVLREAVAPWLPAEILARPKQGFAMPLAETLRQQMPRVRRHLLQGSLAESGLLQPAAIGRMLDQHAARRFDHAQPIWLLLVLGGFLSSEVGAPELRAAA